MPRFPFCVIADVQRHVKGVTFDTESKPTATEVEGFIDDIADEIRGVMDGHGYDTDSIPEVQTTVAAAITAGSNVEVTPASVSGLAIADEVKIEGLSSGARKTETQVVKAVGATTLTIVTVANSYDAGTVTLSLVNAAMKILKSLNSLGAGAKTVKSGMMAITPNKSSLGDDLQAQYLGSEETQGGLWAIANLSGYLSGAGVTTGAQSRGRLSSYNQANADIDEGIPAVIERSMDL